MKGNSPRSKGFLAKLLIFLWKRWVEINSTGKGFTPITKAGIPEKRGPELKIIK